MATLFVTVQRLLKQKQVTCLKYGKIIDYDDIKQNVMFFSESFSSFKFEPIEENGNGWFMIIRKHKLVALIKLINNNEIKLTFIPFWTWPKHSQYVQFDYCLKY